MMGELSGRIAVVTGGGRGLGRGVALALAEHGASVAAVARSADQLQATVKDAGGAGTGRMVAFPTDVSRVEAVDALKSAVEERTRRRSAPTP